MMTEADVFTILEGLTEPQLDEVIVTAGLNEAYLRDDAAPATRAHEILRLLKQRPEWLDEIEPILIQVTSSTRNYFDERLRHIKTFLVDPPQPFNTRPRERGTIKTLLAALKSVGEIEEPQLIDVTGTLFPAALLSAGWWDRRVARGVPGIQWKTTLQKWLFDGFELWAPSWDISWDFEGRDRQAKPYYIAQIAEGDESDSLRIIVGPRRAAECREKFRENPGGVEVKVRGVLGHRHQAGAHFALLPQDLPTEESAGAQDYCVWLNDDEEKHTIQYLDGRQTELYSGYLWKCVVPEPWIPENKKIGLSHVYFIWEHTNFAAPDARDYNLAGLLQKEAYIKDVHKNARLILLAKSHAVVPGDPVWGAKEFYDLFLAQKVIVPSLPGAGESREAGPDRPDSPLIGASDA